MATVSGLVRDAIVEVLQTHLKTGLAALGLPAMPIESVKSASDIRSETFPRVYVMIDGWEQSEDEGTTGHDAFQTRRYTVSVQFAVKSTEGHRDVMEWAEGVGDCITSILEEKWNLPTSAKPEGYSQYSFVSSMDLSPRLKRGSETLRVGELTFEVDVRRQLETYDAL